MRACLVAIVVAGCAYQPGSFQSLRQHFPGDRVTVGCLDVAVERIADSTAGAVLHWELANRCDHATTIDLFSLRAVGRTADGRELVVLPFDPEHTLRPTQIDGRTVGAETFEYRATPEGGPPVDSICVEVGDLVRPVARGAPPTCFDRPAQSPAPDVGVRGDTIAATPIHGYHGAPAFGVWATQMHLPRVTTELELDRVQFTSLMTRDALYVPAGSQSKAAAVSPPVDAALMFEGRTTLSFGHGFYTGVAMGVGGVVGERETLTTSAGTTIHGQSLIGEALAIAGMHGRVGRGSLGFEVVGGVRAVDYQFPGASSTAQTDTISGVSGVLQARVRGELWMNPWMSVGATAGASALDRNEWMTGVYIGLHTRAFDSLR